MKYISLVSSVFLLSSFISSSGAESHARVGKRNLFNSDDNDNRQCVHKCTRDLKREFNSNAVCAKAKDVRMGMEPYRACLGGKDNAFAQVCAASCASSASDSKAKSLLIKSDAEACKNINMGLREKYFWCKRGYNETWEVIKHIIEEEPVEVEESVKGSTDTNQQSDIFQRQALKEVDYVKEEQLKSKDDESANESLRDLADTVQYSNISQTKVLVKEVKERQLKGKVNFEILGRNNTDLGSMMLDVRLNHSRVHRSKEVSSGRSLELYGYSVVEVEAITHLEYLTRHSASASTGTGHYNDFYMQPGWMRRCIHGIGSDSYHDTTLQLKTHMDMDEVAAKLVGDGGSKYEDCAWNIVSSNFTRIRGGIADHMWHYDGGGGEGRGVVIWTARCGGVFQFQFIDTGPSGHAPSSKSFKWDDDWICLEYLLLFEVEPSLDSQQIIDELNPWQHLPVRQQVEQHHRAITEQLGRPLHDWLVISRHMPLDSLSSRAPNITERGLDLKGESESFHSGRFDCTYAPFSSYDVLRLHVRVPMLLDHVDFDAVPSTIASNQIGGDDYHLQQGLPDIGYHCFAVVLFLLALQCNYLSGVRRTIETPAATADYVVILEAFEEIMIKWKFWWRYLVDIDLVGSKILANKSLRLKSHFELARLHSKPGLCWTQCGHRGRHRSGRNRQSLLRVGKALEKSSHKRGVLQRKSRSRLHSRVSVAGCNLLSMSRWSCRNIVLRRQIGVLCLFCSSSFILFTNAFNVASLSLFYFVPFKYRRVVFNGEGSSVGFVLVS